MGNALKKVLVVSACALAAVFAWADRFDGVVRGKGAADPEGYAPVLVANGELAMPIDWNFGVRRDKCRQYSQGIYLEGRRVSHPKRELLPQGHWNRKLFVDGRPAGAPVRWEQKLDTANGTVTCTVEHPEGLVFTGEAFVPRSENTVALKMSVRNVGTQARQVTMGVDYLEPDHPRVVGTWQSCDGKRTWKYRSYGHNVIDGETTVYGGDAQSMLNPGASIERTFFITYDDTMRRHPGLKKSYAALREENCRDWGRYCAEGSVTLPDRELQRMWEMSNYHLYINATRWSFPVGILDSHWKGQYFGFDEMYMYQGMVSSGHFQTARRVPDFRFATLGPALARNRYSSHPTFMKYGARWPWESLEDGTSEGTTPGEWMDHIFHMATIAKCSWQQWLYGRDRAWFEQKGYAIVYESARFYRNNCIYEDSNGDTYIGKCCDLERLGPSRDHPFMTTCGAIYTLRIAAEACELLKTNLVDAADFRVYADRLEKSLPQRDGRYITCWNEPQESMATLAGFFPFPIFGPDNRLQRDAVTHFIENGRASGNMYPTGKKICSWYSATMSAASSWMEDRVEPARWLKEAFSVSGLFGEYFEINEPGAVHHPWFATAAGNAQYAINQMLLCDRGGITYLGFTVPETWRDYAFVLPSLQGVTVKAAVRNGKLAQLELNPRSGVTGTFRFAVRPEIVGPTLPPGVRIVEKKTDRVILAMDIPSVVGLDRSSSGKGNDFLSVPDATIGNIGFRVWEYRSVTNDDVLVQSIDFNDAAQYRPIGKQKVFDTRTESGVTFVRMGENGRSAINAGVRPVRPFSIRSGERYTLRLSARRGGGSGMVYLRFLDANGKNVSDKVSMSVDWTYTPYTLAFYRNCSNISSNWSEQVLSFLAPDGVEQLLPVVAPVSAGKGEWFDCRSLVLEGSPTRIAREEVRLDGREICDDGSIELVSTEAGLKLKASLVREGTAYRIAATVSDVAVPPRPRALQVALEWPHDLVGWMWHRDWRRDEAVVKGSLLRSCNNVSGLDVGIYPFTAVSKDGVGVAIGTELDDPAFEFGMVTDAGISSVRALGLLKRGDFGTSANISWLVIPFRGEWGFRSATKAYYDSQGRKIPAVKVGAKEGTRAYLGVRASDLPDDSSDYGLAYYIPTSDAKQRQIAREKGMFAHPYVLAWQIPSATYADYESIPSMDERLAELQRWLSVTNERAHRNFGTCKRDLAQVLLNSIPLQADGSRPLSLERFDGIVHYWRLNVDPRLPEPNACSTVRDAITQWGLDTIDGVYLDNVYIQQFNNVRPDHLAVMKEPLVYDRETAQPCAQAMQHQVAFVKMLADWLHPLDKRVTGNVFPRGAHRFNATILDVFGCEVGCFGHGTNRSERLRHWIGTDADACEKRFFAWNRPVADLLQDGNFTKPVEAITPAGVTNYVEHHMFYGFYPSVVTIGGENAPGYWGWKRYFDKSRQCVRDRELFKRAIPLIRRLNRAGWMPETLLRADVPKVMVERYGDLDKECFFTVRNETDKPVDAVLRPSPELSAVTGLTPIWRAKDEVPLENGVFRVRLAPWSTEVFRASLRPASVAVEIREDFGGFSLAMTKK